MPLLRLLLTCGALGLLLIGCRSSQITASTDQAATRSTEANAEPFAEPTTAPFFQNQSDVILAATPTLAPSERFPDAFERVEVRPTRNLSTNKDAPEEAIVYGERIVYDDSLHVDWTVDNSNGVKIDLLDSSRANQILSEKIGIQSGQNVIAVTPIIDFGSIYFTVRPGAQEQYRDDDLVGLSFWLNSGATVMENSDLVVAIVGSNDHPHWVEGDRSAFSNPDQDFSETRLYFLNINRSIPAETWVEVVLFLDELIYDPSYTYVTGFYIKNDLNVRNTFYLDQVTLLTK